MWGLHLAQARDRLQEEIIRKKNNNKEKISPLLTLSGTSGNPAQHTHISHRG